MSLQRIQRKRTKGWRMPEGAVYVGRPTRWGNPFVVRRRAGFDSLNSLAYRAIVLCPSWHEVVPRFLLDAGVRASDAERVFDTHGDEATAIKDAAVAFKGLCSARRRTWPEGFAEWLQPLAGRDLACWCPLVDADGNHIPCHADVLLELANSGRP